jgi:hypothetical protein
MISVMAVVLYSSAVLIPQISQQVLGYDATHAGLILSPGGLAVVLLIPLVGRLMKVLQTRLSRRHRIRHHGLAFIYSSRVSPDVSFATLVMMRAAQAAGLAFLFVPISTAAYATLARKVQGDATALFTLFRNPLRVHRYLDQHGTGDHAHASPQRQPGRDSIRRCTRPFASFRPNTCAPLRHSARAPTRRIEWLSDASTRSSARRPRYRPTPMCSCCARFWPSAAVPLAFLFSATKRSAPRRPAAA